MNPEPEIEQYCQLAVVHRVKKPVKKLLPAWYQRKRILICENCYKLRLNQIPGEVRSKKNVWDSKLFGRVS